jgi:hypothetical protein
MVIRVRAFAALVAALALPACVADAPLLQSSDEPVVVLVLSRGPTPGVDAPADSTLHALVVTVGSPRAGFYRSIERFSMRRRSDGTEFDWVITDAIGPVDLSRAWEIPRAEWNAHLAWSGSGARLGRSDLTVGETYDLEIETAGRLVTGEVTMPASTVMQVESAGADRVVTWDPVPNVELYTTETRAGFYLWIPAGDECRVVLHDQSQLPQPGWLRMRTLERNTAAAFNDPTLRSFGLVGAYGVFGAIGLDSIEIPPPDAPATLMKSR